MRLISLILVFAVTSGYSSDSVIEEEFINKTEVDVIDRIRNMGREILQTSHLTPEAMKTLEELEQLPQIELDHSDPRGDYIDEINKKSKIDEKLFQGDIYLDELQGNIIINELKEELEGANRTKRQAIRDKEGVRLWKNHTVHYFFTSSLKEDAKKAFLRGAEMWTKDTCIKFREDPSATVQDLLVVQAKEGCWSNLGKLGNLQHISLADGCETSSIAAHEIGHTLGFYHTMSRHDRNEYVIVNFANIEEKWRSQFAWQREEDNDNFNLGYDYGSIMHYRASDAAINRQQPTLMPYDKYYRETLGSPFVSFIDVLMLNRLYGCDKLCESKETRNGRNGSGKKRNGKCRNGGYPHPFNCSKCVCPDGYAGHRCDERPKGNPRECGQTYDASTEWKNFTDRLGDPRVYRPTENYTKCYYWIQSPENTEIEIEIVSFSRHHAIEGCPNAGVEIKANRNHQLTGYRFCSPSAAGTRLRSYTNRVPIITWNKVSESTAVLRYRHVSKDEPRPTTLGPRTRTTTQPLTTSAPPSPARVQNKCEDRPECPIHIANGFCYRKGVTYEQRKTYCPRGCHLCGSRGF